MRNGGMLGAAQRLSSAVLAVAVLLSIHADIPAHPTRCGLRDYALSGDNVYRTLWSICAIESCCVL